MFTRMALTPCFAQVYILGTDKKVKLSILYPATTGRNFEYDLTNDCFLLCVMIPCHHCSEIIRVIDSLQLTAYHKVCRHSYSVAPFLGICIPWYQIHVSVPRDWSQLNTRESLRLPLPPTGSRVIVAWSSPVSRPRILPPHSPRFVVRLFLGTHCGVSTSLSRFSGSGDQGCAIRQGISSLHTPAQLVSLLVRPRELVFCVFVCQTQRNIDQI